MDQNNVLSPADRRAFWIAAVDLWRSSGLSMAEFCRREKLNPEFWREKYITHSVIMIYINFQLLGTGTIPLENQGNLCFLHGYTLPPKNHPMTHQIQHHQGFSLLEMKFSWLNSGSKIRTSESAVGRRNNHLWFRCRGRL